MSLKMQMEMQMENENENAKGKLKEQILAKKQNHALEFFSGK